MWSHRMMLETLCHSENAFVTLTYAEEHLPAGMSLVPKDMQLWLKRIRKAWTVECRALKLNVKPILRFYGVGEYGDLSERPHYHIALFGFPHCRRGKTEYSDRTGKPKCCRPCQLLHGTWGKGRVSGDVLERKSAQYIAGYITKKMTFRDDPRLYGREPEFARMSNRPGIGYDALWDVASVLMQYDLQDTREDVPTGLRHGTKVLPLGRYLTHKLRALVGKDESAPKAVLDAMAAQVFDVYMAARNSKELPSFKAQLLKANEQKVRNLQSRTKIFKQRRTI